METIKCPVCGNESKFKFVPKTQINPFNSSSHISSINLEFECKHEFPIISIVDLSRLYDTVGDLVKRITILEKS